MSVTKPPVVVGFMSVEMSSAGGSGESYSEFSSSMSFTTRGKFVLPGVSFLEVPAVHSCPYLVEDLRCITLQAGLLCRASLCI